MGETRPVLEGKRVDRIGRLICSFQNNALWRKRVKMTGGHGGGPGGNRHDRLKMAVRMRTVKHLETRGGQDSTLQHIKPLKIRITREPPRPRLGPITSACPPVCLPGLSGSLVAWPTAAGILSAYNLSTGGRRGRRQVRCHIPNLWRWHRACREWRPANGEPAAFAVR